MQTIDFMAECLFLMQCYLLSEDIILERMQSRRCAMQLQEGQRYHPNQLSPITPPAIRPNILIIDVTTQELKLCKVACRKKG